MRYSVLGKTGLRVSALGFGCMRLPMKGDKVDRDLAIPMLHHAVKMGINFFDTAVGYCNSDSQAVLGEAMEGMREKVILSTKNPLSSAGDDEWWRALETSLRLLRTDHLDFYHHHGIQWDVFVKHLDPAKNGKTRLMLKAKEQGLIRHIGFSFHDTPENLVKLVDTGYYENVILQYNLLDQANAQAMQHAHDKGMGVVVMGPVGGGRLGLPSERIGELTGGAAQSTPEAALRFVWAHTGVNVALSGMSDMKQLEQNLSTVENTNPFTKEQVAALDGAISERKKKSGLYCTACRYCIPACSAGVDIPENLEIFNQALIYGLVDHAKHKYAGVGGKASDCINCGKCMPLCPQNIKIPDRLREVAATLDPRTGSVDVALSVGDVKADGTFRITLFVHNFANKERAIQIAVSGAGQTKISTQRKDFGKVSAMARRSLIVEGTADAGCRQVSLSIDITCDGTSQHLDKAYNYFELPQAKLQGWEGEGWQQKEATEKDFSAAKETAGKHGLRFKIAQDKDGLLVHADVRDDFLFPSREESHKGLLVDGLEVYLDGREISHVGRQKYEKGVYQLFLYPGTPGKYPAFFSSPQGLEGVEVVSEPASGGYRIKARIPFVSFCTTPGTPRKIGFDIGVNTADKDGNRVGQFIFAGGGDNWRDASGFRDVWIGSVRA